jgi:phosphoribosylglycinamide formyltransferase-1
MRLAVLASHEGTTLQAVLDACAEGELNAEVALVVSNNSASGAMRRAAQAGAATMHISSKTHASQEARDEALLDALQQAEVEWVLLLGYMKKLGVQTLATYNGRILNTHPALLPKFGGKGFFGRNVHAAVIAAAEKETGATVHLVDTEYDTGPLLSQVRVPVLDTDTVDALEARVKTAEQKLLVETLIELSSRREVSNY